MARPKKQQCHTAKLPVRTPLLPDQSAFQSPSRGVVRARGPIATAPEAVVNPPAALVYVSRGHRECEGPLWV